MTDPTQPHKCTCGGIHKVRVSKHRMHKGLVEALTIFRDFVKARGQRMNWNHVHIRRDLGDRLSRDMENNLSKLRFFGLLVHHKRGDWGITNRGAAFLKNELGIQEGVMTAENKVIGHFGRQVWAFDYVGKKPDFAIDEPAPVESREQQLIK